LICDPVIGMGKGYHAEQIAKTKQTNGKVSPLKRNRCFRKTL